MNIIVFDIIIATYNRSGRVKSLVEQLLSKELKGLNTIIVVDSSDLACKEIFSEHTNCKYFHTIHKNQPYQRYLGHQLSTSDWLLFLDDDMKLNDKSFLDDINAYISANSNFVGFNLGFQNSNYFLNTAPDSVFNSMQSKFLYKTAKMITAYPQLKDNKYGYFGNRGKRSVGLPIEYLSGGAFFAKRNKLYIDFNMQLFQIYDQGLGKGEDGILGYTLSKQGIILAYGSFVFLHKDHRDSSYTVNHYLFNRRVAYSRYYLALEYQRLNKKNGLTVFLLYHWYTLFRIMGLILNLIIHPSKTRFSIFRGWVAGWYKTFSFRFNNNLKINDNWKAEIRKEINSNLTC